MLPTNVASTSASSSSSVRSQPIAGNNPLQPGYRITHHIQSQGIQTWVTVPAMLMTSNNGQLGLLIRDSQRRTQGANIHLTNHSSSFVNEVYTLPIPPDPAIRHPTNPNLPHPTNLDIQQILDQQQVIQQEDSQEVHVNIRTGDAIWSWRNTSYY